MGAQAICEAQLNKMSRPVDSQEFLKNVATISANGDSDLGELIAQAFTMSKKNGAISVKDGKTMKDSVEHVQVIFLSGDFPILRKLNIIDNLDFSAIENFPFFIINRSV